VVHIPNGVDIDLLGDTPAPNRPSDAPFTVLYSGSIGIPNHMETYIEAACLLHARTDIPPIEFVLLGEGVRKNALMKMARDRKLTNLRFLPAVPKKEVPQIIANADLCYLQFKDSPLYQWGVSPNKLFDYLLAAKPILYAANVKTNPVQHAHAGMVLRPGDAQALADAVVQFARMNATERDAMGARGRTYVLTHHTFNTLGKTLADCLKGLRAA
jgi:glycosyltransferase involved in cell wall biosynthesis